ncbi:MULTISPECIES: sugar transferase [Olivibacter]|jgi:lipopolysaccharide/colanic/teichoic acid biosynthesis glycosyltransferase|uniref:Sugar transferase n=2 Tax=Sphingobacteriaceae TaxID=84566 RepID=F4CBN2_SPHS2|nr:MULTISPECIES: sugar transferase [Olivibacter]MCL4637902.1 sugar transferase [Olivibacter sp. UJ_SKK_5.1]MDM8176791.1 sugar transferase [Olivibacter sp. 47]MDX3912908.1 sugar transferase [Pseudosphingobacterium sp.]
MLRDSQIQEMKQATSVDQSIVVPNVMLRTSFTSLIENNFLHYADFPIILINKGEALDITSKFFKRSFDIVFSLVALILGFPLFLLVAIITKLSSKGPVFYKQERIGLHEKPFFIYKFRSMYIDAEKFGPQLAQDVDPRITPWGRLMRKTRLDEIPQFWNVLKGDMSIVGPRPERAHFIKQIVDKAPSYKKLLTIKPGITSIGQVNFGYAQTVDEMCERMLLDLQYLQGINFFADLQIIFKTVKVMFQGKGK